MKSYLFAAAAMCAVASPTFAQQVPVDITGNMLQACASIPNASDERNLFQQGICFGVITAVVKTDVEICEPEDWDRNEAVRLVLTHVSRNRELVSEDLTYVVRDALRRAWGCRRS